jgi:hypothetical protein
MNNGIEYDHVLTETLKHSLTYINNLDDLPVHATKDLEELRNSLGKQLNTNGINSTDVISELVRDVEGGLLSSSGGRFFAWVIGGALPAALAADWLTSTWDQNAAL